MGLSRNNLAIANFFDWFGVVAAALGLLGLFTALVLFYINIDNEGRKRDKGSLCSDKVAMGYFVSRRTGGCLLHRLPCCAGWPRAELPEVPTLNGLFQAGDTLLYTSACFDNIRPSHREICWIDFYSAILDEIAHQPHSFKAIEDSAPLAFKKVLSKAFTSVQSKKEPPESLADLNDVEGDPMNFSPQGPERHTCYQRNNSGKSLLVACVRKMDIYGSGAEQENPQYINTYGFKQLRRVWLFNRQPCIEMNNVELAELSLILGMRLYIRLFGASSRVYGIGAFGIVLDGHICDGVWRTRIIHGERDRSEGASKGSGYSTLHAKYIACGCLPFGQSNGWIKYVHVNDEVCKAIREGHDIDNGDDNSDGPARHAHDFLAELSTVGHWSSYNKFRMRNAAEESSQPHGRLGQTAPGERQEQWRVDETQVVGGEPAEQASWARAVAYVAFGGLVPQSADQLANAIKFTILGDVQVDVQEKRQQAETLEQIVNEIHNLHEKDYLFGPYVPYRLRDHTPDQQYAPMFNFQWNVRLAAATFSRYMTLIEYFVAQFEIFDTDIPDQWIRRRTQERLGESAAARCDVAFDEFVKELEASHNTVIREENLEDNKARHMSKLPRLLERIRDSQRQKTEFVPSRSEVVDLAICVVAIWADHVPRIVVKVFNDQSHTIPVEGIWDTRTRIAFNLDCSATRYPKRINLSGFTQSVDEKVYHAPALDDLPSINAFG